MSAKPPVVATVRDYWPVSHFTTLHLPGRDPLDPGTPCPIAARCPA